MRENSGDGKTARALDIHEIRVGRLHEPFEFVLSLLILWRRVEEVDGESHCRRAASCAMITFG